jgi:hypothetical protein
MAKATEDRCACFICESFDTFGSGGFFATFDPPIGGLICKKCINDPDLDQKFNKGFSKHFADGSDLNFKIVSSQTGHA